MKDFMKLKFAKSVFFSKLLTLVFMLMLGKAYAGSAGVVDFRLNDINNKVHQLSDYRGKWVVVNYWATWCPPCADEIPELNKFHSQHHKKDAVVVGINFEYQDLEYVSAFIEEYSIAYPILITKEMINTPFGQLVGLPTTYLVSPAGKFIDSHIGPLTAKELEMWITNSRVKIKTD